MKHKKKKKRIYKNNSSDTNIEKNENFLGLKINKNTEIHLVSHSTYIITRFKLCI